MIRRPPRSTLDRSSAASDVYKRQLVAVRLERRDRDEGSRPANEAKGLILGIARSVDAVSYTHLRAHETVLDLVCRLLLEKKKKQIS